MFRKACIIIAVIGATASNLGADDRPRRKLEYSRAPVDNPLKGLVPYSGDWKNRFPHSMEFFYLPLSSLVVDREEYDWTPLEEKLNECANRGHQAVFRVYLEYPGRDDGIPRFLMDGGLKIHKYRDSSATKAVTHLTPDYRNPQLRKVLSDFIIALGKKYDGDPRIGFITAGLLGHWGEWHTYPKDKLFAAKEVQAEVLDAYESTFKVTPVLLRYPAGRDHELMTPNDRRRFGYHDDSFAWGTLDTAKKDDDWFFIPLLKSAGLAALDKWQTSPIGGEIRPEAWGRVFDEKPGLREIQDFGTCVRETHASWVMDSGMFEDNQDPDRIKRAKVQVQRIGYEFHIKSAAIDDSIAGQISVEVEVENTGIAPFYYDWPVEFGLLLGRDVIKTYQGSGHLTGLLPGDTTWVWKDVLRIREGKPVDPLTKAAVPQARKDLSVVPPGQLSLAIRVPNPLPKGNPVRFANKSQDADADGWMTLGKVLEKPKE